MILFLLNLIGWKRAFTWLKPRPKVADAITVALISIIIVGMFVAFSHFHDANVIEQHDASRDAEIATGALNAEHTADNASAAVLSELDARKDAIKEAQNNAIAQSPEDARRPVGPVTTATIDELRKHRKAGVR